MSKGWDNATLKKLKALTGKGLSTSEIGKRLGMSKNAVVGKLNRLGWNLKAGGAQVAVAKKSAPVAKKEKVTATTTKKAPAKATPKVTTKKAAPETEKVKKAPATKAVPKKAATKTNAKVAAPKVAPAPEKKSAKSATKNLAMHQRIIQHSLEMANLKPNQCRWPIGDPDSEHFHFCGETVFVGKPYCYEHCKQAYQFTQKKQ